MLKAIIRLPGFIIAILALSILPAICGTLDQKGGKPVMYVYEFTHQPTNADDYDEVAALASMQGIINRDEPVLYINNDGYGRPEYWLDIMSKDGRWLEGRTRRTITGLDAVYKLAQKKLKGAVIWDPEVPASVNVATTIAGVEDAVILSPTMAEKYLKKWNLGVIKDLRGMFTGKETGSKKNDAYRWAIREYIDKGKCNPHFLCLYTDAFYDRKPGQIAYLILRDWAVKNRAFTYDLSPWGDEVPGDDPDQQMGTDLATYKIMLEATLKQSAGKQMTEVAGFFNFQKYSNMPGHPSKHDPVPTEWETVYLISPYNCYQNTATEFTYNQSFHSHAPVKRLKQNRPTVKKKLENKSYIAILMADYDSTFPLYNFMPNFWADKSRGDLPLNWGINPNLIEAYPDIISYFYETASPNDYFVADASAAGYMNPNRVQKKYLPLFVKHNSKFYKQTDMTISGMVLDWDQPTDDVKDAFTKFSPDGYATIVADMHGGGGKPPQPHVWKGMPVVQLLGADPNSPEYTAGEIYNAVKKRKKNEPGFYDFRCVWVSPAQVKASIDLFAKQHPEEQFEVVDLYTFFDLFKQHYAQTVSGKSVITNIPESSACIDGYSFGTHYTIRNVTEKPMKVSFTATGLKDAVLTPANATLKPGKEIEVMVSGKAVSDKVTVNAHGPFGLTQSVTNVKRIPIKEIPGAIPKNENLQFVSDLGIYTLSHLTGEQVTDSDGSISWEAKKGIAKPGFLAFGPYGGLNTGRYLAIFRIKRTGEGTGDVAQIDISMGGKPIGAASRMITADDLPLGEYRSVALIIDNSQQGGAYESRINWTGNTSLALDRVIIWKIVD
ncbi:MAG: GxGYxYP domain-containing protein [Armatimonadota bacterium]